MHEGLEIESLHSGFEAVLLLDGKGFQQASRNWEGVSNVCNNAQVAKASRHEVLIDRMNDVRNEGRFLAGTMHRVAHVVVIDEDVEAELATHELREKETVRIMHQYSGRVRKRSNILTRSSLANCPSGLACGP